VPSVTWIVAAAAVATVGAALGRWAAVRRAQAFAAGVRAVTEAIARAAAAQRSEILRGAEIDGRNEARDLGAAADTFCQVREAELEQRTRRLGAREAEVEALGARLAEALGQLAAGEAGLAERRAEAEGHRRDVASLGRDARAALEAGAGESGGAIIDAIREGEIDEARLAAGRIQRAAAELAREGASKPGKRLIGIATGRFAGHYLTERLLSVVPLGPPDRNDALIGPDGANLRAIGEVAGVTLTLTERRDAVRLEGLDGVGREVARRTLARLGREPQLASDPAAAARAARGIATALAGELAELGRRAFATLEIPPAHPDIVNLVGRLNYRTSYTQNQWKHAVEAAFLCGMMAEELGLDAKLARRAALMHDIGKALTHELDGSHAVIGADYARRLGEPEVVANAIGAHHTDEPFASPYAYLVAAADALSGARPGARRQTDDNYLSRIEDLERITRGFRGVAEAFAVQGGREVRVYVEEDRVDDVGAVELSGAIAAKISTEMRFPGQIRVTVIRTIAAVEVAS
jgi:ribonucrease Y